jgi:surfeit locus 1 family protein
VKNRIIKFNKYRIELFPLLFTILSLLVLVSLGFWQLIRLKEKNLFLTLVETNLKNLPVDFISANNGTLYSKIRIKGQFLTGKDVHLYGRRSMAIEKDGYYLLSPFQTDNNEIIMVARGWFSRQDKKNIDNIKNSLNEEVIGIALPDENKRFFIPENDFKHNIWFTLNLTQMSSILGVRLEKFYLLMQADKSNISNMLKPLPINNLLNIRNDHLEYALTWFSLALALAAIFIMYHIKKAKLE